jgi:phage protein U
VSAILWLGSIALDALSVRDMPASHSWEYAEHKTIQGLPVLQFIDRNAASYTLNVRAHKALGTPPRETIAKLKAAGNAGEVLILQTGTGEQLGSYVLTALDETRLISTPRGELLMADLSLKLKEHRFVDFEVVQGIAVEGNTANDTATPVPIDDSGDPDDVPLSTIVRSA